MEKISPRVSAIKIEAALDDKNIPEQIQWEADDAEAGKHKATAMLLAFWNAQEKTSLRIDLWTKEMTIPEMNIFFFQTLLSMADSLHRATQNQKGADDLRQFAKSFFEKVQNEG